MSIGNMTESDQPRLPAEIEAALATVLADLRPLQNLVRILWDPELIVLMQSAAAEGEPGAETLVAGIEKAYGYFNRLSSDFFCDLTPDLPVLPQELLVVAHIHSLVLLARYLEPAFPDFGMIWPGGMEDLARVLQSCVQLWHYVVTNDVVFSKATRRGATEQDCASARALIEARRSQHTS